MSAKRLLARLLIAVGACEMFAVAAVAMPTVWMAATHAWIGLGDWPETAILSYLARTVSMMYVVHGAILIACGCDVTRYDSLIRWLAWLSLGQAVLFVLADVGAGMPLWWRVAEPAWYLGFGVSVFVFSSRSQSEREA